MVSQSFHGLGLRVCMSSLHQVFVQAAHDAPQAAFLAQSALSGGREWTYVEALHEVTALAKTYADAGWGHGHRVALALRNHPLHFLHFLALNAAGASIVPMNPDHKRAEIRHALGRARVSLAVADALQAPVLRDAIASDPALSAMPVVLASAFDTTLPRATRPQTAPHADSEREAAILYTSGTTGLPKGCVITNEYIVNAGRWYAATGGLLHLRRAQERLLNPLPAYHMNCGLLSFACLCLTRNCLVLPERFSASTWWEDCARSGATAIHYLGIMPPALFKQPPGDWDRAHRVRYGFGAGCDPTLHAAFEERFGFPLVEVWGMTETGRFLADNMEPRMRNTRAFGRPVAPLQARVVDADDRPVPHGTPGELVVRAEDATPRRGFFSGYLEDEEATRTAWRGEWFHTGDVVVADDSGMLHFVDRKKDIIRRSGENISASEVEAVLAVHPEVMRVAVMPVADDMRDEEVLAVIVPRAGAAADEALAHLLVQHCLSQLAFFKAPGWLAFAADLPVTPTNKIQKTRIFAKGEDPRLQAFDLRSLKTRSRT